MRVPLAHRRLLTCGKLTPGPSLSTIFLCSLRTNVLIDPMREFVRSSGRSSARTVSGNLARVLGVALALAVPDLAAAQQSAEGATVPGRRPIVPEFVLRTGDAVAICLGDQPQWIDFCNGLVQGYAEYVNLTRKACIPVGTSRRELVAVFTAPEIVISTGYIDNWPAFDTAVEVFIRHYPCE